MKPNEEIFKNQENKDVYEGESFDLYKYYDIQIAFISDSLIINYKPKIVDEKENAKLQLMHSANALIIIVNRIQTYYYNCLKEKSIFIRGGISNGYCIIDENFAVGEGLIKAYKIESKVADYPRIVLDKEITEQEGFVDTINLITKHIYKVDSILTKDDNDNYFVNYLKFNIAITNSTLKNDKRAKQVIYSFIQLHKDCLIAKLAEITKSLQNSKSEIESVKLQKVQDKFLWLKNYHNENVQELGADLKIE